MLDNINQITTILVILLGVMLVVLVALAIFLFVVKPKKKSKKAETIVAQDSEGKKIPVSYNKQSIFKFMEFDKVDDNMIFLKNGAKYVMVVECQGINYDLMSSVEKIGVEEGFIQFLNTLRHSIQIYTQTRTINLEDSIQNYKAKVKEIEESLVRREQEYNDMKQSGKYTQEEVDRELYDLTKQKNLFEYGKDIIYNTEKMSLNKNVLRKNYYIIIPYYPSDLGNTSFDKEEIKNIAFQELYTRSQSIIRTIAGFGVNGRILDSYELVDLLYVAYNRDESETYGLSKAILAGYDELYSTAPDVLNKKIEEINRQIEEEAMDLVNEKIAQVQSEQDETLEDIQDSLEELIKERAKLIIEENKQYIGEETADKVAQKIDDAKGTKEKAQKKSPKTVKGGNKDVGEKEKTRRARAV